MCLKFSISQSQGILCKPLAEIGEQILFWIGVQVLCRVWVYSDIWGSMNGRIRCWLGPEACWKTAGAEEWGENVMWASFCGWCKDSLTPPSPLQLLSRLKSLFIWWDAFQKFEEQDHINTFFFFFPWRGGVNLSLIANWNGYDSGAKMWCAVLCLGWSVGAASQNVFFFIFYLHNGLHLHVWTDRGDTVMLVGRIRFPGPNLSICTTESVF